MNVMFPQDEYYEHVTDYEYVSPLCYDAIWAIALALNCTDTMLKNTGTCTCAHYENMPM